MERIEFHNRIVSPITSESGQRDYYEHLNYWRVCYHNKNTLILPTKENALEYIQLKSESEKFYLSNNKESRKKLRQYQLYDTQYDWRPQKTGGDGYVGLISPTGEQLLTDSFADVFTQFDAINSKPCFVPVFNGEAWALVSLTNPHLLITNFQYNAIIPERWEHRLFFMQDKTSMKWGALKITYPFLNRKHYQDSLPLLEILMPPIADEIYEDELMTEEQPTTFFITRRGDKIGILTDFGYSAIDYDTFEADDSKCSFRLIRNDRKRARRADYWHPSGKGRLRNLKRTKQ